MRARTLYLYGKLGKELGREHKIYVNSIPEAMKYLAANFGEKFYANIKEGYYKIKKVVGKKTDYIGADGLYLGLGEGDLYLIPVAKGAASQRQKQVGMIVAGVALAAVTFGAGAVLAASAGTIGSVGAAFTTTAGASAAIAATGTVGTVAFGMSAALVLQGIAGLLTPIAKVKNQEGPAQNAGTSASIQNTGIEGSTISVIYGKMKVGSVVVSSGVYAEQMATDKQYSVVKNYLKEYITQVTSMINSYNTAINTTGSSASVKASRNGGYTYYPGRYPNIRTSLVSIRDTFSGLLNQAKTLQKQDVTTFSLSDYTTLVDSTLAYCNTVEPILLSMYSTVGEVCDFYVSNDVFNMKKRSMYYQEDVVATSLIATSSGSGTYAAYYASTRTDNTVRKRNTLTPLDDCYFMTRVVHYVLKTLKDKEDW